MPTIIMNAIHQSKIRTAMKVIYPVEAKVEGLRKKITVAASEEINKIMKGSTVEVRTIIKVIMLKST